MRFEEWLLSFERVATWNDWGEAEKLIQLPGHLRGKALQEWSLLNTADTAGYTEATSVLKERLDPSRKALAVQDFRNLSQGRQESVADFILRLEQTFCRAYGCNKVCEESRHALLHAQLQEGLKYAIMEAPAVLGSETYRKLCMAAKNEEHGQSELAKRQQYTRTTIQSGSNSVSRAQARTVPRDQATLTHIPRPSTKAPLQKRCYICNSPDHLANKCDAKQGESQGRSRQSTARPVVGSSEEPPQSREIPDLETSQPRRWARIH